MPRAGGGGWCGGGSGRQIQCVPLIYHKAMGIRWESWVHTETQPGRADPVLSSSAPEPGVIWGSGSAPWLCSHSELTALHADGNSMGSSLDLAELAAGQLARADIIQQALEGPPEPGGATQKEPGLENGGTR